MCVSVRVCAIVLIRFWDCSRLCSCECVNESMNASRGVFSISMCMSEICVCACVWICACVWTYVGVWLWVCACSMCGCVDERVLVSVWLFALICLCSDLCICVYACVWISVMTLSASCICNFASLFMCVCVYVPNVCICSVSVWDVSYQ